MLNPVFQLELLRAGRRNWQHAFRWVYASWLLVQLLALWSRVRFLVLPGLILLDLDGVTDSFAELLVLQQCTLVLLVTPAFTAGAVTEEKARTTLPFLLMTDLTAWDIVAGKWPGRVVQVGVLLLTGLPLLCLFGGLDPVALLAVGVAT